MKYITLVLMILFIPLVLAIEQSGSTYTANTAFVSYGQSNESTTSYEISQEGGQFYIGKFNNSSNYTLEVGISYLIESNTTEFTSPELGYGFINGTLYGNTSNMTMQVGNVSAAITLYNPTLSWYAGNGTVYQGYYDSRAVIDGLARAVNIDGGYDIINCVGCTGEVNYYFDLTNDTDISYIINKTHIDGSGYYGHLGQGIVTVFNTSDRLNHNNATDITGWENITSGLYNGSSNDAAFTLNFSRTTTRYVRVHIKKFGPGNDLKVREIMFYGIRTKLSPLEIPTSMNYTVNSCYDNSSLGVCFGMNWSLAYDQLNWSNPVTLAGNFTWNFTELGVLPINNWLFNLTNYNLTQNITAQIKLNHTNPYWDLFYGTTNLSKTEFTSIVSISTNTSKLINLTLNVYNISETYVNWTQIRNTARWDFNFTIRAIEN